MSITQPSIHNLFVVAKLFKKNVLSAGYSKKLSPPFTSPLSTSSQLYPTSTLSYVLKSRDQSNEYIEAIPEKIVLAAKAYHAVVRWLSFGFDVHLSSYHDVLGGSLF